jgi:hypothetical protein
MSRQTDDAAEEPVSDHTDLDEDESVTKLTPEAMEAFVEQLEQDDE